MKNQIKAFLDQLPPEYDEYVSSIAKLHEDYEQLKSEFKESSEVVATALDVFTRVGRRRMRIIKWLWPDIQRLSDALYDYWDKIQPLEKGVSNGKFDSRSYSGA